MGVTIWTPPRFSDVPWLSTQADLRPAGLAEVLIDEGPYRVIGMKVMNPFGGRYAAMVNVRCRRGNGNDGGVITISISEPVSIAEAREAFMARTGEEDKD